MTNPFKTVIVDDTRTFKIVSNPSVYFRTSKDALLFLEHNKHEHLDNLYLDHDLGEGGDIKEVVLWLAEAEYNDSPFDVDVIFVHSMNPVGAEHTLKTLQRHNYNAVRIPLPDLIDLDKIDYDNSSEEHHRNFRLIQGGKS